MSEQVTRPLQPLPRCPSKTEEIEHVKRFVESLPCASYLADILRNIPVECEALIRQDVCIPPTVAQLWEERRRLQDENKTTRAEYDQKRAELERDIRELGRAKRVLSSEVESIKTSARELLSRLRGNI